MSVTAIDVPSPRLITKPAEMPVVDLTTIVVSLTAASDVSCVAVTVPPVPTIAVTCVPVGTPETDTGEPNGGAEPVKPTTEDPVAVIKLVVTVPDCPLDITLKFGVPTDAPV